MLKKKAPPGSHWFETDPCVRGKLQKGLISNIGAFPCRLMSTNNYLYLCILKKKYINFIALVSIHKNNQQTKLGFGICLRSTGLLIHMRELFLFILTGRWVFAGVGSAQCLQRVLNLGEAFSLPTSDPPLLHKAWISVKS